MISEHTSKLAYAAKSDATNKPEKDVAEQVEEGELEDDENDDEVKKADHKSSKSKSAKS